MNQKFTEPILTPTTTAHYGLHDEPISRDAIVSGLIEESVYSRAEEYAIQLFAAGQKWAAEQGLILVDTKYEFGLVNGELIVIDEIHTPDSSRYWISDEYEDRYQSGKKQNMLDKENIRQWLIEKGFSGEGTPPKLTEEIRIFLAEQYIELFEILTGESFEPAIGDVQERIQNNLENAGVVV